MSAADKPREGEAPAEPPDWPTRKRPAHGVLIPATGPVIVFLTVCTKERRPWLATHDNHRLLRKVWTKATAWLVGRYVLMPDHVHLFAAPSAHELPFDNWVRYWKSQFTKAVGRAVRVAGSSPASCGRGSAGASPSRATRRGSAGASPSHYRDAVPVGRWQADHWDTRLRRGESYDQKWEYVRRNPQRHRLVTNAEDWPFQGELFRLPWE